MVEPQRGSRWEPRPSPNVIGATGPIGYCGPLKLPPAPSTITVGPASGAPGMDAPLTLEFAVIPVAATAATDACP